MAYDFAAAAAQAASTVSNEGQQATYKYPILYPNQGNLDFRILFNPKSNLISRLIYRHGINGKKVPCLRTYGMECPICKALEDIKSVTNQDLGTLRRVTRGISFGQYISSNYAVGTKDHPIKANDICIMMYPWSVYQGLQEYINKIASTPTGMTEAFTKAEAYPITITRGTDNKYSVMPNPYNRHRQFNTDEEFMKMIEGVDSLSDQVLPATATQDVIAEVNAAVEEINKTYLRGAVAAPPIIQSQDQVMPQYGAVPVPQAPVMSAPPTQVPSYGNVQFTPSQVTPTAPPFNNSTNVSPAVTPNAAAPACYGKYTGSPMCGLCPVELNCKQASGK